VKVFTFFVLVLAYVVSTPADTTQTWVVTATCIDESAEGIPCTLPGNISAVFTTQLETGTFIDSEEGENHPFTGTEAVVTNISGTLDGQAMSLVPFPENDWIQQDGTPEDILFDAGGQQYSLHFDNGVRLSTFDDFELLEWSAVATVPEPAIFWMLSTALLLLGLSRWAQVSLQKLSGR
jgi:hypothetical protein